MRHTLETRTVQQLKNVKNRRTNNLIRDRYIRAMEQMGYSYEEAFRCFADVWDVAMLEMYAERAA